MKPSKIDETIIYVLEKLNRDVGSIELAKYIYLIDIESIRFTGKSITGQIYNRAPQGPLAEDFKKSTQKMNGYEIEIEIVENVNDSGADTHLHRIGKNYRFHHDFNEIDKAIMNRVLARYFNCSVGQLKKIAYRTKPWKAIENFEKKENIEYRGAVDLSEENKISSVLEWEKNIEKEPPLDRNHLEYLEKESKEFDELLASLT